MLSSGHDLPQVRADLENARRLHRQQADDPSSIAARVRASIGLFPDLGNWLLDGEIDPSDTVLGYATELSEVLGCAAQSWPYMDPPRQAHDLSTVLLQIARGIRKYEDSRRREEGGSDHARAQ